MPDRHYRRWVVLVLRAARPLRALWYDVRVWHWISAWLLLFALGMLVG